MVETWTPATVGGEPEIPRVRAELELQAKQQLNADLALQAIRASDQITAAADHLSSQFDRLIEALRPWRRPVIISMVAGESTDRALELPSGGPCVVETITIIPGATQAGSAATSGTVEARIRGLFGVDISVFGFSTTGEVVPNNIYNIPVEADRRVHVELNAIGAATGYWHVVILLAREQLRV
jgi:hypothetical protein